MSFTPLNSSNHICCIICNSQIFRTHCRHFDHHAFIHAPENKIKKDLRKSENMLMVQMFFGKKLWLHNF